MAVELRILGPLELWSQGVRVPVGGVHQQKVLAALVLGVGERVPTARLVEVLWHEHPPATSVQQVHKHIHALRRLPGVEITTDSPGYRLTLPPACVDAQRFAAHFDKARKLRLGELDEEAEGELRAALALWHGSALAGLTGALRADATRLDEERISAQEEWFDVEISLGRHAEVVTDLAALVERHPFRERLVERLMLAQYRSGRQAEALDTYQRLRVRMSSELGMEPAGQLRDLYAAILRRSPVLGGSATRSIGGTGWFAPVPACLPVDLPSFVGRTDQLRGLTDIEASGVPIASITGTAGVGKTALAVHWAHRARDRYPDGQLHVDLRGHDQAPPMPPSEALSGFLRALGTPPEQIPEGLDAQQAQFRSTVDGKRILVVLDNASSAEQIRPLLPGSPGCFVLVTSRNALTSLAVLNDVHKVPLDVLSQTEAAALLRRIVGDVRVTAEPLAAGELLRLCGYLPLALRIIAANLAGRPHDTIAGMVHVLGGRDRLAQFGVDGEPHSSVRAALDLSYAAVDAAAQRLLCLFGASPLADIGLATAAALIDAPLDDTRLVLATLESAHLVQQYLPGRYRLHDLIKLYAAGQDVAGLPAAAGRLVERYLVDTDAAVTTLVPTMQQEPRPPTVSASPQQTDALPWFRAEHDNLVSAVHWAHEHGHDVLAVHLVDALRGLFWLQRSIPDWLATGELGLAIARTLGDTRLEAAMHRTLGLAYFILSRRKDAVHHNLLSLRLCQEIGDWDGATTMHINLGITYNSWGRPVEAVHHFEQAIDVTERRDRQAGIDHVYALLGLHCSHAHMGRLREAFDEAGLAMTLTHPLGSAVLQTQARSARGWIYFEMGLLAPAEEDLSTAIRVKAEIGNKGGELYDLAWLGHLHLVSGELHEAAEVFQTVIDLSAELGDHVREIFATIGQSKVQLLLGRWDATLVLLRRAQEMVGASGTIWAEIQTHTGLADLQLARHDLATAADHADTAIRLGTEQNLLLHVGDAHHVAAKISLAGGDAGQARAQALRALELHRRNGQRLREAADLLLLGDISAAAAICNEIARDRAADVLRTLMSQVGPDVA